MASSHEEATHPTPATYAKIAVTLGLITAFEVLILYVDALTSFIIPIFIILSTVKFAMVAMFYMHLKFDNKLFTLFFASGVILATFVIFCLMLLFGAIGNGRYGSPEVATEISHTETHSDKAHDSTDKTVTTDSDYDTDASKTNDVVVASTSIIEIGTNGDQLSFDQTKMSAQAGEQVTVSFVNSAGAQQHNWVLVPAGPARLEIATLGMTAATTGWVPDDHRIIAHTNLINPGETGEVSFQVPSEGSYEFVCTFPGHSFTMFGEFEITQ